MRLMLNSLYFLENGGRECLLLKAVFELRLMSLIGLLPDLLTCRICGTYTDKYMYLRFQKGFFLCDKCARLRVVYDLCRLSKGAMYAFRLIALADLDKIWNFKLPIDQQYELNEATEKFLLYQLQKKFKTLDFYYTVSSDYEEVPFEPHLENQTIGALVSDDFKGIPIDPDAPTEYSDYSTKKDKKKGFYGYNNERKL